MTVLTRATLKKEKELTVPLMLQMRATCTPSAFCPERREEAILTVIGMQWSHALPLVSALGIDASLFAIANRAGKVVFWS
jgi:general transcription factor 3C protein 4